MTTAIAIAFLGLAVAAPQRTLEAELKTIIAASGAEVAVAFRTLDEKSWLFIDAEKPFHAASTMKVPVMIELFTQAKAGTVSLDDRLPIRNEFRSIVDGSPYSLSVGDDSDKDVYAQMGKMMTLRQLCEAMITVSSNFAANLLIDKLGAANIQATMNGIGADGMQVRRGVEDQKAFDQGLNNSTNAMALFRIFLRLARHTMVDEKRDVEMIEILKRQAFNNAIPAGLPAGTPVAHKTGNITRIHHDAAIVFGPRPYVVVLLVRGIQEQKESAALMAKLSRVIYDAVR